MGEILPVLPKQATTLEREQPKWKPVLRPIFGPARYFDFANTT
jgi:hypothetical protein